LLAIEQIIDGRVMASKWLGMASQKASELGAAVIGVGDERFLRAYGSWPHPNILGGFLAIAFVGWLYLLIRIKNEYQKRFILIVGFFITAGIFFSFSRGAWLVFGVLYLLGWIYILKNKAEAVCKRFLAGVGIVMIAFLIFFWPLASARIWGGVNNRLETKSNTERVTGYRQAGAIIKNNIIGVGIGNYTFFVKDFYKIENAWEIQPVHNVYLLAAVELGVVGIIMIIAIIVALARALYQNKRYFYLVAFLSFLLLGLWDHYGWTTATGFYSIFLGLALLDREIK
jgi:O-antigen ligase